MVRIKFTMTQLKAAMRILIPVDGSSFSQTAVAFMASRAALIQTQPEVELLNIQYPVSSRVVRAAGSQMVDDFQASQASKVLKPCVATFKRAGLIARSQFFVGNPGTAVGKAAAAQAADLIVMGSHGHTGFKRVLFGSVTNAVLASCTTPVLVLRDEVILKKDSLRVGIALDGGKYGLAAAKFVVKHHELFGTEPIFTLMHVGPDLMSMLMPSLLGKKPVPGFEPSQVQAMQLAAFEQAVSAPRKLLEAAGLKVNEAQLIANNPGDEIAAYVKKNKLDMVVMGSHGRGALRSVTMGSVSTRVASKCTRPLLLIRRT
jgi:nucleotide-binding universal stress UspA family protein